MVNERNKSRLDFSVASHDKLKRSEQVQPLSACARVCVGAGITWLSVSLGVFRQEIMYLRVLGTRKRMGRGEGRTGDRGKGTVDRGE